MREIMGVIMQIMLVIVVVMAIMEIFKYRLRWLLLYKELGSLGLLIRLLKMEAIRWSGTVSAK